MPIVKPKYESVKLSDLKSDPANVRKHDDRNIEAIKASLDRFGQQKPIVIDEKGVVIAGNGTIAAARSLGWETVEAVRSDLSGSERTAYAIADNRTAELAAWDNDELARILASLENDESIDELVTGFTSDEIAELIDESAGGEVQEDEVPEVEDGPAITQTGDVWLCGRHRVLCGDSTVEGDVAKCLDGAKPFIMVTDPPYGVEYDPQWRQDAAEAGHLAYACRRIGQVTNDDRVDWTEAYQLFPGVVAYVWHASAKIDVALNLRDAGLEIRTQIIWRKPAFCISRGHYHWQHEASWYAVRKGSAKWCGDRSQSTVWDITPAKTDRGDIGHGTQKPVECMARPIRNHGGKDDDVYDPFLGSGTTIIAAEQLGRTCYGIEISPNYCDVICKRYMASTGESPIRESDGAVFSDLIADE